MRALICAVMLVGCGESLFDSHGNGSNGPDSAVPLSCPAPCLGDAAGDFDGTANGATGKWQYLEDARNRTWAAMTAGDIATGADAANTITTCDAHSSAACDELPHALLISSSGATSAADPAIAYKVSDNKVIQLTLRVLVPSGSSDQVVRLYRNSREDSLFTATASAGTVVQVAMNIDALAGDRILLAIAPKAGGATGIAVHLFVNDTQMTFPQSCLLAATFDSSSAATVDNLCGGSLTHHDDSGTDTAATLGASPFTELGQAADIAATTYFQSSDVLVKTGDSTTQLWVKQRAEEAEAAYPFSDLDLDSGGGLAIDLYDDGALHLEVATCTSANPLTIANVLASYPNDHEWHFVRVSHAAGKVSVCIDGVQVSSLPVPSGALKSGFAPYIGKDVVWTPAGSYFNGFIDDVRVFNVALPCE